MKTQNGTRQSIRNTLLGSLPSVEFAELASHFEHVQLQQGQVLIAPEESIHEAYFPEDALVSMVTHLLDGSSVEAGVAGHEGMVGLPAILGVERTPVEYVVQIPGRAIRVKAEVVREQFRQGGELQRLLLGYSHALFLQAAQSVACQARHPVEGRLTRWLLASSDGVGSTELPLTQESAAQMLGARRAGVTVAAHALKEAGLISYSRGLIRIADRQRMEAATCECYGVIKGQMESVAGHGRQTSGGA